MHIINRPRTLKQKKRLAASEFFRIQQKHQRERLNALPTWTPAVLNPISILRSGYDGAVYQDANGTTAGAEGMPIGLLLDSQHGLERGEDLYPSGQFDPITWGTANGGSITDGILHSSGGSGTVAYEVLAEYKAEAGKHYEFSFDVLSVSAGSVCPRISPNNFPSVSTVGRHTMIVTTEADAGFAFSSTGFTGTIGNISIRPILGHHASQATSAYRPLLNANLLDIIDADDAMTVSTPAIASATIGIAKPTGAVIQTGVDLSTGSYTIAEDGYAWVIVDRALTADEQSKLAEWLNAEAGL